MAEIAVKLVFDKLIPLLRDEVTFQRDVRGQLMSIERQLRLIRAYLKDADVKAEMEKTSDVLKEWVTQMREISYRIEDVIDEYLFKEPNEPPLWCGAVGVLCKICDFLRNVIPPHEISCEIRAIKVSLEGLNQIRENLALNQSPPESSSQGNGISTRHFLRWGDRSSEEDELVAIEPAKQLLTRWLLKESSRTVISVVGEGGLGKTTIVNKVYKEQKKEESFSSYAWITVGRSLRGEHLLKTLTQRLYEDDGNKDAAKEISEMDNNTLIEKLRERLQGRSYMIVFDDVWEEAFLGTVVYALPKERGKIIITTRDRRVAEFCGRHGPIHIHDMEPLDPDDAWDLFCQKTFPEGCPKDLEGLSKEFIKKCNGVPLAIVAIAGLLSTKNKSISEWQKAYDSLRSKFSSDPHLSSFHQVLSESYHDLSYHLKLCLLYFGLFPEDYSISSVRLINLWIAEGFVEDKENEGQTLEEVAEEYLGELIARSLVKVDQVYSYGRVRSCQVHDLMHDFILRKCEEMNFFQVKKSEAFRFREWTRRLSIDTNIEDVTVKRSAANYGLIRSCFVFNIQEMPTSVVESLFSSFRLLVRLDCEDAPLDYLPEAVARLLHLKYLNLRNTYIEMIPSFIGKLQNLETLDLKNTLVTELPLEINRLFKLRNLLVYHTMDWIGVKFKEGIGHLTALQKLSKVNASDDGNEVIKELKNLKQMRKLSFCKLIRKNGKLLCSAIESMTYLCSLTIEAEKDEVLDLESLTDPPQHLQRLYLFGRLEKLPEWIPKLKNLVRLRLAGSRLTEDPLPLLKDLSELLELNLRELDVGELHFQEGWFMKLKRLEIVSYNSSFLKALKIDEGAMPHLQVLALYPLPPTKEVPDHILKVMWVFP